jgi:hypothetical protein
VLYKLLHATEIDNETLTFRKLANDLRRELTKSQTPKPGPGRVVAKGAFGPSFADLNETKQPKEDEQGKKKKSKRKLTAGESLAKCPTCKIQGHTLANCLYIFLEKAKGTFRGWKG